MVVALALLLLVALGELVACTKVSRGSPHKNAKYGGSPRETSEHATTPSATNRRSTRAVRKDNTQPGSPHNSRTHLQPKRGAQLALHVSVLLGREPGQRQQRQVRLGGREVERGRQLAGPEELALAEPGGEERHEVIGHGMREWVRMLKTDT